MKFQVNVEIDEAQANMSKMDLVELTIRSISDSLEKLNAYFDVGVNVEHIISGFIN